MGEKRPSEMHCTLCHGLGVWGSDNADCLCREIPDPARVRQVLMLLDVSQIAFLRAFEHTLADQPVTKDEWDTHLTEFWVEDDDAVVDGYEVLVPATKIWFAGGRASSPAGSSEFSYWINYTPLGLALRHCLLGLSADARCA
ncbi:hypothetical protein GG804_25285 [Sphingomonas histidinilytica]|uniref:hypothetical protein n=1 Tax=Rhizorhabdus histidinilytica TaxID=439228 RepID=UPI001AD9AFE7|nr:hypothetical protein [Rhizorhabdus histidinilytica]MBO9380087.1 hypothetical protein [Rhizorhabdus histidinilytica]